MCQPSSALGRLPRGVYGLVEKKMKHSAALGLVFSLICSCRQNQSDCGFRRAFCLDIVSVLSTQGFQHERWNLCPFETYTKVISQFNKWEDYTINTIYATNKLLSKVMSKSKKIPPKMRNLWENNVKLTVEWESCSTVLDGLWGPRCILDIYRPDCPEKCCGYPCSRFWWPLTFHLVPLLSRYPLLHRKSKNVTGRYPWHLHNTFTLPRGIKFSPAAGSSLMFTALIK